MSTHKKVEVEVIDESETNYGDAVDKVNHKMSEEFKVFSQAAAIYFKNYHDLQVASEAKKKTPSLRDFFLNSQKAHKAAWKYVVEHSEVHRANEDRAKDFLPESSIEDFHDWLDDKE